MEVTPIDTGPDEREESLNMIRDSAAGVLQGDVTRARGLRFGTAGYDPAKLREFGDLGWFMLRLPEDAGGLGLGLGALVAIARQMGRALTPEPVWQMALAATLHPDAALLAGETIVLPAFAPFGGAAPQLRDGRLSGTVEPVLLGARATAFVVQTDQGAALVRADAEGLRLTPRETHDGGHLAWITFENSPATPLPGDMDALREEAALALAAYSLGVAETAFDLTNGYLKDRKQFDRPIGGFQALQHRMVDLMLEVALTRATVEQTAEIADRGTTPDELRRQVSLARAQAGTTADLVTRTAIQLHGGIGYTDEADIGLYLRKAMTLSGLLGSTLFHNDRALRLTETRS